MDIEYEATFAKINKKEIKKKLKEAGAILEKNEFLQKRIAFESPDGDKNSWFRVRNEGDKITMSYKKVDGDKIENQKEICLQVDSYFKAIKLLKQLGCKQKSYQETKREIWKINEVDICIDEWPYLEPFLEIEANSEEEVKKVAKILNLDYSRAIFGGVDTLYSKKYGIPLEVINGQTKRITFDDKNPFI